MSESLPLRLAPDVAAAAGGDATAFGRLVDATAGTVTSITLAILRDMEMSRDVAQEVYLLAWRDLRRLREPTSFLPWLRQLARNRAHQALRGHVRQRRRFTDNGEDADALLAAAADPRPDALQRLADAEDRAALAEAIAALPPSARECVVLYYREGRSAAQVAALLDLSEDAVKQRLSRARRRLRESLARRLADTAPGTAFTATVVAGVASMAMPAVASAAVVSAGKAGKAGAAAGIMSAATFSALAGLAGGWAGTIFGMRKLLDVARDDEERRGVIAVSVFCMGVTLSFLVAILVWPTPLSATVAFTWMMGAFWVSHFVWLPRVTRRRRAAEMLEDPTAAMAAGELTRRHARIGFAAGTLLGGGAVLASWFF